MLDAELGFVDTLRGRLKTADPVFMEEKPMEQIFEQRKQARYGEMQQLYFSLYGEDDGALSYFFQMLERYFQN